MTDEVNERSAALRGYRFFRLLVAAICPPIRYWVVYHNAHQRTMVVRQRRHPGVEKDFMMTGVVTLDGPFEYQEDAAQRLAFWNHQYQPRGISEWQTR
jgi:hypothetical protein